MKPITRLAGLHLAALALCLPLFVLTRSNTGQIWEFWAYSAVAAIYGAIASVGRPSGLFEGLKRLGVDRKPGRALFFFVSVGALGVAQAKLIDNKIADVIFLSLVALGIAAFFYAIVLVLNSGVAENNQGSEQ